MMLDTVVHVPVDEPADRIHAAMLTRFKKRKDTFHGTTQAGTDAWQ